jgi:hypothetical protein
VSYGNAALGLIGANPVTVRLQENPSNVSPTLERVPLARCPKGGDISGRATGTSRGKLPRRIRISQTTDVYRSICAKAL